MLPHETGSSVERWPFKKSGKGYAPDREITDVIECLFFSINRIVIAEMALVCLPVRQTQAFLKDFPSQGLGLVAVAHGFARFDPKIVIFPAEPGRLLSLPVEPFERLMGTLLVQQATCNIADRRGLTFTQVDCFDIGIDVTYCIGQILQMTEGLHARKVGTIVSLRI
ncbi:hypothetical protein GLUCORHAEAF1_14590 [Komagataeibacter rhaeticus AF1]|nr:hypothetical protein GLUCORHAEAF1_14590 [Komagataeibacter rhaeticus AF1]